MPTSDPMRVTAREVGLCLMYHRFRRSTVIPNYTPPGWWESDVYEVTKCGYAREYEIKLTRADFKADRKKGQSKLAMINGRLEWVVDQTKHDMLRRGDPAGPVQFWYVTPKGMITRQDLPPWAGLIEFEWRGTGWMPLSEREVVRAPRLHNKKVSERRISALFQTCYWRLHSEMWSNRLILDIPEFEWDQQVGPTNFEPEPPEVEQVADRDEKSHCPAG